MSVQNLIDSKHITTIEEFLSDIDIVLSNLDISISDALKSTSCLNEGGVSLSPPVATPLTTSSSPPLQKHLQSDELREAQQTTSRNFNWDRLTNRCPPRTYDVINRYKTYSPDTMFQYPSAVYQQPFVETYMQPVFQPVVQRVVQPVYPLPYPTRNEPMPTEATPHTTRSSLSQQFPLESNDLSEVPQTTKSQGVLQIPRIEDVYLPIQDIYESVGCIADTMVSDDVLSEEISRAPASFGQYPILAYQQPRVYQQPAIHKQNFVYQQPVVYQQPTVYQQRFVYQQPAIYQQPPLDPLLYSTHDVPVPTEATPHATSSSPSQHMTLEPDDKIEAPIKTSNPQHITVVNDYTDYSPPAYYWPHLPATQTVVQPVVQPVIHPVILHVVQPVGPPVYPQLYHTRNETMASVATPHTTRSSPTQQMPLESNDMSEALTTTKSQPLLQIPRINTNIELFEPKVEQFLSNVDIVLSNLDRRISDALKNSSCSNEGDVYLSPPTATPLTTRSSPPVGPPIYPLPYSTRNKAMATEVIPHTTRSSPTQQMPLDANDLSEALPTIKSQGVLQIRRNNINNDLCEPKVNLFLNNVDIVLSNLDRRISDALKNSVCSNEGAASLSPPTATPLTTRSSPPGAPPVYSQPCPTRNEPIINEVNPDTTRSSPTQQMPLESVDLSEAPQTTKIQGVLQIPRINTNSELCEPKVKEFLSNVDIVLYNLDRKISVALKNSSCSNDRGVSLSPSIGTPPLTTRSSPPVGPPVYPLPYSTRYETMHTEAIPHTTRSSPSQQLPLEADDLIAASKATKTERAGLSEIPNPGDVLEALSRTAFSLLEILRSNIDILVNGKGTHPHTDCC